MKLRKFTLDDYEDVVDMFYSLNKEIYANYREVSPKYFYYKIVIDWINSGKHIVLSEDKNGTITGFTMSYIDENNGLTEKIYNGEIAYVKPKYRKGRSAYLLYNNVVNVAKELNLNLNSNSRVENGVDKMVEKHFEADRFFVNFERKKND